jgi:hypothetical protein
MHDSGNAGALPMKLLSVLTLALALVLVPTAAQAGGVHARLITNEQQGIVYALPKHSPFKLSKKTGDGVQFSGRAVITGKYVYGRLSPADEIGLPEPQPDLYFVPDAQSVAQLPYWSEKKNVDGFYFTNGDEFLRQIVSPDIVRKIKARKIRSVSGNLTIEIEGYFANVECGWPIYATKFIGIARTARMVATNKYADSISCSG